MLSLLARKELRWIGKRRIKPTFGWVGVFFVIIQRSEFVMPAGESIFYKAINGKEICRIQTIKLVK